MLNLSETVQSTPSHLSSQHIGIAVLLLDAENLQLSANTEQFLTTVCTCPIQVKIAFANWCSMGKLDVELHGRGYDLIHVPVGKDNADGKMIVFGSSVHERYLNAKEVLVCSSDKVMTNLCNHLQQNGLMVYRVSKQGDELIVFNNSTGKIITQFTTNPPELTTLEKFVKQIKELIKTEQQRTKNCWIKLSNISQLFKNKYHLSISQITAHYFPDKKARDIFTNYPAEFVLHQIDESSELYVTLFDINQEQPEKGKNYAAVNSAKSSLISAINSQADLEIAFKNLINELAKKSADGYVNIGNLSSKFNQEYGKPITDQIKSLRLSVNFPKFLQSCSSLKMKQTKNGWEVAIR